MEAFVPTRFVEVFRYIWCRFAPHRLMYAFSFVLGLGYTAVMMLTPLVNEWYMTYLEQGRAADIKLLLTISAVGIVLLIGIHLLGTYLKYSYITSLSRELMADTFDHAHRLPYDRYSRYQPGDLYHRITHDSTNTSFLVSRVVDEIGSQIIALLIAAAYMISLNEWLAVGVLMLMPAALYSSHMLRGKLQNIGMEVAEQQARVRQTIQDMLQGMETVRAYDAEAWFLARYERDKERLNKLSLRRMWLNMAVEGLSSTMSMLLVWASVLIIAWLAIEGRMQLGELMAFFILIWRIYNPLVNLGHVWGAIQQGLGTARRIFELHRNVEEKVSEGRSVPGEYAVMWRNVSYRYPLEEADQDGSERGIENIQIEVPLGEWIAIVGPSGSGKSTIAKLGAGLLEPDNGEVWVGGVPAHGDHALVAYVPQTSHLFSGTIRENIKLVNPDATDEMIREVLETVVADGFVSQQPNGLDTIVAEDGSSFSGGERQRLVLARALLSGRPILILDEATSALDYKTEARLMQNLSRWTVERGITWIVITHRLAAVRDAAKIYVVKDGRIVEQGTHAELLSASGVYHQLSQEMQTG